MPRTPRGPARDRPRQCWPGVSSALYVASSCFLASGVSRTSPHTSPSRRVRAGVVQVADLLRVDGGDRGYAECDPPRLRRAARRRKSARELSAAMSRGRSAASNCGIRVDQQRRDGGIVERREGRRGNAVDGSARGSAAAAICRRSGARASMSDCSAAAARRDGSPLSSSAIRRASSSRCRPAEQARRAPAPCRRTSGVR